MRLEDFDHHIDLYGCRRCGTNYTTVLVEDNFDSVRIIRIHRNWKHEIPDTERDNPFIVCVKNPFAWVVSLTRYRNKRYSKTSDDVHEAPTLENIHSEDIQMFLEGYFAKYASWLDYMDRSPHHSLLVRHEDMIEPGGPQSFLKRAEALFGLQRSGDLHNISDIVGASTGGTRTSTSFDYSYYREKRYLDDLPSKKWTPIRRVLKRPPNQSVMERLGYSIDDYLTEP